MPNSRLENTAIHNLANFNVQWFRFNIENLNQMDFDEDDRAEFELKDGDLLVCEGGEIGRCAVWHNEIQPCFFRKHFTECGAIAKLFILIIWHGGLSIIVIMMDLRLLLDPKLP